MKKILLYIFLISNLNANNLIYDNGLIKIAEPTEFSIFKFEDDLNNFVEISNNEYVPNGTLIRVEVPHTPGSVSYLKHNDVMITGESISYDFVSAETNVVACGKYREIPAPSVNLLPNCPWEEIISFPTFVIVSEEGERIIPPLIPERLGYSFVNWNTSPDGSGLEFQPGDVTTFSTLFAIWEVRN